MQVYVCVRACGLSIDNHRRKKGGWDVGGGSAIRSGPLTSLCADKEDTHSDVHSTTSKTANTPQSYLPVAFVFLYFGFPGEWG